MAKNSLSIQLKRGGFRRIKGTRFYYVNKKGVVISTHSKKTKWRILKTSLSKGYPELCLCENGMTIKMKVHRLVGLTFIPNPKNYPFINHINNDPTDNRVENLEWCTPSMNIKHAYATGRKSNKGEKNSMYGKKHTKEAIKKIIAANVRRHAKAKASKLLKENPSPGRTK